MNITIHYNGGEFGAALGGSYDIEASMRAYEDALDEAIHAVYPDAEVEIICNRNAEGWCQSPSVDGRRDTREAVELEGLCSDVWCDMQSWLVES